MKINIIRCLFFICCVQLLTTSTLSVENKFSSSGENNLADHGATTVTDIDPQEDGGRAPAEHAVKNMIVTSKKSQGGKAGSGGGGNNAVHGDHKKNAASTLPQSLSFYISVFFTFTLLVLPF